ncbi:hypothetical protein AAG747_13560 [Rapidithrix thailandica]|uniref:Uncharacterized protein n=1 Tax=Rapidithrix thailandica TaxID=413964 RepID=A0AAW9S9B1_9BACT
MKKLTITLLFTLITVFSVNGQSSSFFQAKEIVWGKKQKGNRILPFLRGQVYPYKDKFLVVMDYTVKKMNTAELHRYDAKLNLEKVVSLPLEHAGKELYLLYSKVLKGKFYFFGYQWNKAKRGVDIYALEINPETMNIAGKPKKLFEISDLFTSFNPLNLNNMMKKARANISVDVSRDSSKLVFQQGTPNLKGQDQQQFVFNVFDTKLNELWEKTLELPYVNKEFGLVGYLINDHADLYLLGKVYHKGILSKKKSSYHYEIWQYSGKENAVPKTYKIQPEDWRINELSMRLNKRGDLICTGLYSEKKEDTSKGVYYMSVDRNTQQIRKENYQEFDAEILNYFMPEKKAKKGNGELGGLELRGLVTRPDGSVVLLSETSFILSGGSEPSYPIFINGNILITNINSDGNVAWSRVIPKHQSMRYANAWCSFTYESKGQEVYILYTDNIENFDIPFEDHKNYKRVGLNGNKKTTLNMVKVEADGTMSKQLLYKNMKDAMVIRPRSSKKISENELLLLGRWGIKNYKIGIVELK